MIKKKSKTCKQNLSKKATLALKKLRKYIETNEGMEDLFKPLDYLENIIEINVLNKNNQ